MKKIISFSLWGNHPVYVAGALRNAELAAEIYPGWTCRFYLGRDVSHELVQKLGAFPHVETVTVPEPPGWRGMFWRFYPAAESDVEVLLVRDVDCRLNRREAGAVLEWLGSSKGFHIMRDHPQHRTEILGGLWGLKHSVLPSLRKQIYRYKPDESFWQIDQNFLRDVVFPLIRNNACVHDEFFGGRRFPTPRSGGEFVGQAFDEFDQPLHPEHQAMLHTPPQTLEFRSGAVSEAKVPEPERLGTTDPLALTLLVPTCGRPENMRQLAHSVEGTVADPARVSLTFGIHPDDRASQRAAAELVDENKICIRTLSLEREPVLNLSRLWNRLYEGTNDPILGFFGDDVVFRTPGWDFSVREEFRSDLRFLIYGDDRLQRGQLATLFFTHRRIHQEMGLYMNESFRRIYMDTWWDRIYRSQKRARYRPDLIFEHLHPSIHPEREDEMFRRMSVLEAPDETTWASQKSQRELAQAISRFRRVCWKIGWERLLLRMGLKQVPG